VIPTRPLDRYGIGFYGVLLSDDFTSHPIIGDLIEDEWGMEVFYNAALTPWLQFSPSVQYVHSGLSSVKDSVIVTTRLQIYF
jgi:porin